MSTFDELYERAISDCPEAVDAAIQLLELVLSSDEEQELFELNESQMVRNILRISCTHGAEFAEARTVANRALKRMGI
jgi:4'-phosphopantetheinyl transferase EntD